jgi:N-acyl-L-homoserine lactone synthetase
MKHAVGSCRGHQLLGVNIREWVVCLAVALGAINAWEYGFPTVARRATLVNTARHARSRGACQMMLVIDSFNKHRHRDILAGMFELRARLSAVLPCLADGVPQVQGADEFDRLDPAYVIGLSNDLAVISCARILQTTGPHMLADTWCELLEGEPPLRSATLWEASAFCIDTDHLAAAGQGPGSVTGALCDLMAGVLDYARTNGIQDVIALLPPDWDSLLRQAQILPDDYLVPPSGAGRGVAGLWACHDQQIVPLRILAQRDGTLFHDPAYLRKPGAGQGQIVNLGLDLADDIALYLLEQIDAASTLQELQAAIALTRHMLAPDGPGKSRGTLWG